jgi:hypothetical protein
MQWLCHTAHPITCPASQYCCAAYLSYMPASSALVLPSTQTQSQIRCRVLLRPHHRQGENLVGWSSAVSKRCTPGVMLAMVLRQACTWREAARALQQQPRTCVPYLTSSSTQATIKQHRPCTRACTAQKRHQLLQQLTITSTAQLLGLAPVTSLGRCVTQDM